MQQKTYTVEEAKRVLERYCVYQDRCHKEINQKLYDMGMIPEVREVISVHLIEHNFLNEERFAKSFVRGKFNIKKWGKIRIVRELKLRNISEYLIKIGLQEINNEDYLNSFDTLTQKKFNSFNGDHSLKNKKKFIDYLMYRGWESNLIYERVNELMNNNS